MNIPRLQQRPRIAVPACTSLDPEYNRRSLPLYYRAIQAAGGEAVPLDLALMEGQMEVVAAECEGFLLPGSPADVWPGRYGETCEPTTAAADLLREGADLLLLEHAERFGKPVLGVCYGLQSMNTWRGGALVQDVSPIPVNHTAGPAVAVAHGLEVEQNSRLGGMAEGRRERVNSSHHQAVGRVGRGLRVTARCTEDGVIEAIEGDGPRFLVGVQWHPERSYEISEMSRNLFQQLVLEARKR